MNTKTILHVVISLKVGGLERFVLDLTSVCQNNIKHFIVCLEDKGDLAGSSEIEMVALQMTPGLHIGVALNIFKIVREKHVDIIHTHNEKAQLYGGLAGLLAGVPVVHTKHGKNDINWRSILRNNISAYLCRKVVAVSVDAALQCSEIEKIPSAKVLTILNGIDVGRFSPDCAQKGPKKRLGGPEGNLVIGIVARLAQVKDHETLFDACRILQESGHQFSLLVVGDGPLRGYLEERAHSFGISKRVAFTGMREDIPDLLGAMDMFALSSLSEGISLTLLEAMACCLPIVATAVGGTPEVVVDGVTGFLVPPRCPELLADRLKVLLDDRELRQKMGKAGRQRVVNQFSISDTSDKYRQLYLTLLG